MPITSLVLSNILQQESNSNQLQTGEATMSAQAELDIKMEERSKMFADLWQPYQGCLNINEKEGCGSTGMIDDDIDLMDVYPQIFECSGNEEDETCATNSPTYALRDPARFLTAKTLEIARDFPLYVRIVDIPITNVVRFELTSNHLKEKLFVYKNEICCLNAMLSRLVFDKRIDSPLSTRHLTPKERIIMLDMRHKACAVSQAIDELSRTTNVLTPMKKPLTVLLDIVGECEYFNITPAQLVLLFYSYLESKNLTSLTN